MHLYIYIHIYIYIDIEIFTDRQVDGLMDRLIQVGLLMERENEA